MKLLVAMAAGLRCMGAQTRKLISVPDLERRLARWRPVKMPFDASGLTDSEKGMIGKLVESCRYLDDIFWRQSDPEGLELYKSLVKTGGDPELQRLLLINGGRFDLIDDNKPFVGSQPMPPGRGLYPEGVTRAELDRYIRPAPRKENRDIQHLHRGPPRGDGFVGVPYHVEYRQWLEPAARLLREAAALSHDAKFAGFCDARAAALLSDDYYPSDLQWMDLDDPEDRPHLRAR